MVSKSIDTIIRIFIDVGVYLMCFAMLFKTQEKKEVKKMPSALMSDWKTDRTELQLS